MRFILVLLAIVFAAGSASSTPTVYFEPAAVQVEQGATFPMGIRIDAGTDTLTCFLVEFAFDAETIELVSAEEGTLFAESGHATLFDWDVFTPGLHQCNDVTLGFEAFVMCPGELVHLTFHALSEGSTPISITAVDLRDLRRDPILPVLTQGGLVTVGPGTGLPEGEADPEVARLVCFPNPFTEGTSIELSGTADAGLSDQGAVITVYDAAGRLVTYGTLDGRRGEGAWLWSGRDAAGRRLPGGVYFITASFEGVVVRERVTLLR